MAYNPKDHLIKLSGKGGSALYLPTAQRLVWFREEWPHGTVAVASITISEQIAIFVATVTKADADGTVKGWAQGHGSETPGDFKDYIEKAETKAIGRALAVLGYGAAHAPDLDDSDAIADAPVPSATPPHPAPPEATERVTEQPVPVNIDGEIRRTMAAAKDKLGDDEIKIVILARYDVTSRKDLSKEQHEELRRWLNRHDATGWGVMLDFIRAITAATTVADIDQVARKMSAAGVLDPDLVACGKRCKEALSNDGQLAGMPQPVREYGS